MSTRLQVDAVTVGYRQEPVLREISFCVDRGGFTGVIGPNGSGKSTLLKTMSGLLPPWSGSVKFDTRDMSELSPREIGRKIAAVPQETSVTFPFTVMEMVLFGRTPHLSGFAFEGESDLRAAEKALERTGTLSLASRPVTELSGGERQRVTLARALAQEADVLLLDEPSAFLDIRHEVEIYDLLRELCEEGVTVVSVLHDLNLAALYCDHVVLLSSGSVFCAGDPQQVMTYANLTEVYGTEIYVVMNDLTGTMNILPLDAKHRDGMPSQGSAPPPGKIR